MAFRDDNKLARFFDFQEINYSSLACDIHHYLSQVLHIEFISLKDPILKVFFFKVTTAEFLREHQSKFLGCYTKSLEEVLKKLGIAKTFSLEDVTGEYIAKSPIAFLMGFAYVIPRFIEDQEQFLIASDATLDNKERMRALLKSGPRILKAVQISLDNLGLYQEYGAFDTMKNLLR